MVNMYEKHRVNNAEEALGFIENGWRVYYLEHVPDYGWFQHYLAWDGYDTNYVWNHEFSQGTVSDVQLNEEEIGRIVERIQGLLEKGYEVWAE